MNRGWESLLKVLPPWLRGETGRYESSLQEVRLRLQRPPELITKEQRIWLHQPVVKEDLAFCINAASRYSPWTAAAAAQGYLPAPGGHRIGICGEVTVQEGQVTGIRTPRSLCIRVARDVDGIAGDLEGLTGSVLILGAPGWGKTTLLRDLIRQRSRMETVTVVDERGELFPEGFDPGPQTDVLTGCPKTSGILQAVRTMGPEAVAVDEITEETDCQAILRAAGCGVRLLATAHAGSLQEFRSRRIYEPLAEVFQNVAVLRKDQTYQVERVVL